MSYIVPRDIPKGCEHCPFNGHTKCRMMPIGCDEYPLVGRRPDWCPLIEIPTPHGRLGDLDALKAQYKYGEADSEDEKVWMMNIRRAIANAPTVIEAEGETE